MKKICSTLLLLGFVLLSTNTLQADPKKDYEKARTHWVDSVMSKLTTRQQAAQLMVKACFPSLGEEHLAKMYEMVKTEQLGGITMSRSGPVLHVQTLNHLQSLSNIPLMICMDAEWGVAMRLDSVVQFPRQTTLGAISNNQLIYEMGKEVAVQCKRLGIQMNFAPVVDVNNNPNNPVINSRSFGENKYKVTEKGSAYMRGMQDNGVLTSLKHFPGHGDTDVDSHAALPLISHGKKRLDTLELYPFKQLIKEGAASVMVAHLHIPALQKKDTMPSSLSKSVVTKLLRKKLNFDGLIITDGLEMKGVTSQCPPNRIPVQAFIAGNDILLGVENPTGALDEFEAAIARGEVSKKQLAKVCRKVLEKKYDVGLTHFTPISTDGLIGDLNSPSAVQLRGELALNALTLLRNNNSILPLDVKQFPSIAYLAVGNGEDSTFSKTLSTFGKCAQFSISKKPTQAQADSVKALLQPYSVVLVGYHSSDPRPQFNYGVDSTNLKLIEGLTQSKRVILDYFGYPYGIMKFGNTDVFEAVIVSYDNSPESQTSSVGLMVGSAPAIGTLPVSISKEYREGFGIQLPIRPSLPAPVQIPVGAR